MHYKCLVTHDKNGKPQPMYSPSKVIVGGGEGFPIRSLEKWPGTICEMSQDLIIALFKGNEKLCLFLAEGVNTAPLLDVFAFIANQVSCYV